MNVYEATYIRGRDHDDWDKLTVMAYDEADAKNQAQRKIPGGCRLKKIKLIKTSAETRTNPCNMAQAKISRIEPANPPTWTGSHGLMYAFDVDLSDGTTGTVNCKTPNKWNVGDDVEYTASSTHHGTKLRLDKPGFQQNAGGFKGGGSNDVKGIVASWAVGCAMQAAGDPFQKDYDSIVLQLARVALSARKVIKDEVEV